MDVAELRGQTHGAVKVEHLFAFVVLFVDRQQNKYAVGDYLAVQMVIFLRALQNGEAVVDGVGKTGCVIDLNEVRDKSR